MRDAGGIRDETGTRAQRGARRTGAAAGRERGGGARGCGGRRFPLECGAVPAAGAIRGFCVIIGLENIEGEQAYHD